MLLRIATRRSRLALWQAQHVATRLQQAHPDLDVELVPMSTKGDRILNVTLSKIGGKGLFIKELEQAILDGEADLAVHSMKDVPAELPDGFVIAAMLERHDPRDAMVGCTLDNLPQGACVGTSSLRRAAQLKHVRGDLRIRPIRGNVETRLSKLHSGEFAAIVLAVAGLERLELAEHIAERLAPEVCLPASGQGAVGVECRDDPKLIERLAALEHAPTRLAVTAERVVTQTLAASCTSPLAAHAIVDGDGLALQTVLAHPDGHDVISAIASGTDPHIVGTEAANHLLAHGGRSLLAAVEHYQHE